MKIVRDSISRFNKSVFKFRRSYKVILKTTAERSLTHTGTLVSAHMTKTTCTGLVNRMTLIITVNLRRKQNRFSDCIQSTLNPVFPLPNGLHGVTDRIPDRWEQLARNVEHGATECLPAVSPLLVNRIRIS
ncbi:hypothetical protein FGIG_01969 [Fasciola gigantica]|uniref:Uncharacterized protein n=1 Tax=Fasciola gigantica TaxID=46835 RepID=A0A504YHL6_FASGI|nr:hypothetical protein FGIG_01969 [Fasciola gigantica]